MNTNNKNYSFQEIKLNLSGNPQIFNFFYVVENGRSEFKDGFESLEIHDKKKFKSLLSRIASNQTYDSPHLRHQLAGHSYGEIKPHGHRFFFFLACGNNYIIFAYASKKRTLSLGPDYFCQLERKKDYYAKEFKKFHQRNR